MEVLLTVGMLLIFALVFYLRKSKRPTSGRGEGTQYAGLVPFSRGYPTLWGTAFDHAFKRHVGCSADRYFYTSVINLNSLSVADRQRKSSIIERCKPMELLHLELESHNETDSLAIIVTRADGSEIGYLDRNVAALLHKDADKSKHWYAVFKQANHLPETGEINGEIVLVRMNLNLELANSD
jgi:hypothetical protein